MILTGWLRPCSLLTSLVCVVWMMACNQVVLHVYDLSNGLAKTVSQATWTETRTHVPEEIARASS
jgi:hypothetical protein